ncbi:RING finger protein 151-like [Dermacentor andersoni]|uniref:RING finger protein 151-like n=1 Tax=Dermacentor andersoni TaxID=34620 RepID=UPI002155CFF0|nr:RING finger protein 151-like [Dermacentor andersoni]
MGSFVWEMFGAFPPHPTAAASASRSATTWRAEWPTDPALYSVENFEPRPPQELVCTVCLGVYRNPVECPCRHVFCSDCINGWLANSNGFGGASCPVCRRGVAAFQLVPVLPLVSNMIARLTVRCPNRDAGCTAKVTMETLNSHLGSCQFRRAPCPDCGSQIRPSELMAHRRERCSKRMVRCTRDCGLSLSADRLRDHSCVQEMRNYIVSLERQRDHTQLNVQRLQHQVEDLTARLATAPASGHII